MSSREQFALADPEWAREFTPGAELQDQVNQAIASGSNELVVAAGDYSFGEKAFIIANATGFALTGAGAAASHLWFSPGYGVEVLSCLDTVVSGFSTDTVTPPNSQARLVAADNVSSTIVIDVESGFPLPVASDSVLFNQTCPTAPPGLRNGQCGEIKAPLADSASCAMCQSHASPATARIIPGQQMTNPMASADCNTATRRCNVSLAYGPAWPPPPGSLVTMSPRAFASKYAIPTYYKGTTFVYNSTRVTLASYTTHSAGDMTYLENLGEGGHTYRGVNILRRPSPPYPARLLASNSDGFHSFGCGTGGTLEGCEFEFIADDYLNFHNRELLLGSTLGCPSHADHASMLVVDPGDVLGHNVHPGQDWVTHPRHITHTMASLAKGDTLKMYSSSAGKDGLYPLAATLLIEGLAQLPAQGMPALPAGLVGRIEPDAPALWNVTYTTEACASLPMYGGYVQIDRFSSFYGAVRNRHAPGKSPLVVVL
eukprot:gene235-2379_t